MKKTENDIEKDDIEQYIESERAKISEELAEIQQELIKLMERLENYIDVIEREIKAAFEAGDDKAWLSLTNKKAIFLQRLSEIVEIIKKQKC